MAKMSPSRAWFYLKKRQGAGNGTNQGGTRVRPDTTLKGGAKP